MSARPLTHAPVRALPIVFLVALHAGPTRLFAQTLWRVQAASVTFEIRNAGFPVRGSFEGPVAEVCFDPLRPEAGRLAGTVDPATIDTGIGIRDRHLRRRDYFAVESYPAIEATSIRLWKAPEGYAGTFVLRIRDVEREIEIPFEFEPAGGGARLSGRFTLDRLDYGLGKPSLILADDVGVEVVLDLARAGDRGDEGPACDSRRSEGVRAGMVEPS